MKLYEKQSASSFAETHLLGNGRLGATVYGGVPFEEILIHDDTLWSGSESYRVNEQYYDNLLRARELVLQGEVKKANNIINDEMEGTWGEAYMPLASVHVCIGQKNDRRNMKLWRIMNPEESTPIQGYSRVLDLETAVETIEYTSGDASYRREYFVSYDKQLIYARFSAQNTELNLAVSIDSKLMHTICMSDDTLTLRGRAPDHSEPSYTRMEPGTLYLEENASQSLRFAAQLRVIATDGSIFSDRSRIYVNGGSYAVVAIAAGTNYAGYMQERNHDVNSVVSKISQQLNAAANWNDALAAHISDHKALYGRVSLNLDEEITGALPTSQRLSLNGSGVFDPSVSALIAQYARYLIISGSRPGSQAENLQGIWNDSIRPPWSSNYTTNINVEMNYWPAEIFALSECHEPMCDLVNETAISGHRTARDYYHLDGWTAHHNVDLWRMSVPACEDAAFFFWPFGGAWMCQHLWTHYEYTHDEKFLRETAYPVIREAARFVLGYLCEDGDRLTIAPSTSPENRHIIPGGRSYRDMVSMVDPENRFSSNLVEISALTKGSCMDMTFTRELFNNVLNSTKLLGIEEDELCARMRDALTRLSPYRISKFGTLQEWYEDYEECTPGMGHVSHLYSVYPASIINERDFPAEYKAAYLSLQRRIAHCGMTTDWPGAWAMCLAARFHDRELCTRLLASVPTNLGSNMLTKDTFQIDAVFGYAAGVGEMLLQSHNGYIELLPTPAYGWVNGSFSGLRARHGFECDLQWKANTICSGRIISHLGGSCAIKAEGLKSVVLPDGNELLPGEDGIARFESIVNGVYILNF